MKKSLIITTFSCGVFLVITSLASMQVTYFGINPTALKTLSTFSLFDIFPHAYAQEKLLDNFISADNLYEYILNAVKLIMKFFIYPALIVIWVWTGFSFVMAQGAPEALTKAKKWLMWAFVTTLIIMVLQGFLFALRNSINKILGKTAIHCPVDHKRIYS